MPIEPSTIFVQEILGYYQETRDPVSEDEAKEIAHRLLALVELLARPTPPENLPVVSGPKPIPRQPEGVRIGSGKEDPAPLEPGDHPRPARPPDKEVTTPLPF